MKSTIVHHEGEEHREYELMMETLPENPEKYFNQEVVRGVDEENNPSGWNWKGMGTAIRGKEFCQVVD